MQKKLKFVVACEVIDNVRLMKPHGMVPYTMGKHFGYKAEVVTYRNGEYPYAKRELGGALRLRFLPSLWSKKAKLPFWWYIARNARSIDVLMVYNVKKRPIYNGLLYKLFNPRGFLYAKADTSSPRFGFYVDNAFFVYRWWMRLLGKLFLKHCDAVSVESRPVFDSVTQVDRDKLMLMPCGFDPDIVARLGVHRRAFPDKENIVLHVARMGIPQKNSEHLLSTIAAMVIPEGWQFVFIGSQTPEFQNAIAEFRQLNPEKARKVTFLEHIADKALLYQWYSRSKIFCLPSRRETFGNVLVEAQYFGNVIAGSEHLPSVQDLTNDGRTGITFPADDPAITARALTQLMANPEQLKAMSEQAREYADMHLVWQAVMLPLHEKIQAHYQPKGS